MLCKLCANDHLQDEGCDGTQYDADGIPRDRTPTLADWAKDQRCKVNYRDATGADWISKPERACWASIPDRNLLDRRTAWNLSDYTVTTVTGGSIWFARKRI